MSTQENTSNTRTRWNARYPLLRRIPWLVRQDLTAVYSRDLHKWLLIAPVLGILTGLVITAIAYVLLDQLWPAVLGQYLHHHWMIVPGLLFGSALAGVIMQFCTPDPDEHSTEEIIRSYHEHEGAINVRPFVPKILAAIASVGFGGSAALEGPSIYGGGAPLFNFASTATYSGRDLGWCALLGLLVGLVAMVFVLTFRRVRGFFVAWRIAHWQKLALGGVLTGLCALLFLQLYPGTLVPIGPNYEAVGAILSTHHSTLELLNFSIFKLAATLFTLASGGVSAMFVPLFLTGGALGTAFAQSVVHSAGLEMYAAVGMAAFIAAGYKAPLAAVVFVAEATGGHSFIIPALIGAAVAYAVSGDASASGDQRLHDGAEPHAPAAK